MNISNFNMLAVLMLLALAGLMSGCLGDSSGSSGGGSVQTGEPRAEATVTQDNAPEVVQAVAGGLDEAMGVIGDLDDLVVFASVDASRDQKLLPWLRQQADFLKSYADPDAVKAANSETWDCSEGGKVTFSWSESGTWEKGDEKGSVSFDNCAESFATINGRMNFEESWDETGSLYELEEFKFEFLNVRIATTNGQASSISINGSMHERCKFYSDFDHCRIRSPGMEVVADGLKFGVYQMDWKEWEYFALNKVWEEEQSFTYILDSPALDGSIKLEVLETIGLNNDQPEVGRVRATGAGGSNVTVAFSDSGAKVEVDATGNGSIDCSGNDLNLADLETGNWTCN